MSSLEGRVAIVTGAGGGIGAAIAAAFAKEGAKVACVDLAPPDAVVAGIVAAGGRRWGLRRM